jgi:DNA-binding NtrC family response regulator
MGAMTDESLETVEKEHIKSVLRLTNGNKRQAAKLLKVSRGTLYRRLRDYGLDRLISRPQDAIKDL